MRDGRASGKDSGAGSAEVWCDCSERAHQHYRPGTDCGLCGRDRCPAFKAAESDMSWWRLVLAVVGVVLTVYGVFLAAGAAEERSVNGLVVVIQPGPYGPRIEIRTERSVPVPVSSTYPIVEG